MQSTQDFKYQEIQVCTCPVSIKCSGGGMLLAAVQDKRRVASWQSPPTRRLGGQAAACPLCLVVWEQILGCQILRDPCKQPTDQASLQLYSPKAVLPRQTYPCTVLIRTVSLLQCVLTLHGWLQGGYRLVPEVPGLKQCIHPDDVMLSPA